MQDEKPAPIRIPNMCQKHQTFLIHQANYKKEDPWQSLVIVSQVVLFQAEARKHSGEAGNIVKAQKCLACLNPDVFGEIVETAKESWDLGKIKAIGDRIVAEGQKTEN